MEAPRIIGGKDYITTKESAAAINEAMRCNPPGSVPMVGGGYVKYDLSCHTVDGQIPVYPSVLSRFQAKILKWIRSM